MSNLVRVSNNTARPLVFPSLPVAGPDGKAFKSFVLPPGHYYESPKSKASPLPVNLGAYFAAAEKLGRHGLNAGIAKLKSTKTPEGKPMLAISVTKVKEPEGPEPPQTLREFSPEQALLIVQHTSDRAALERYALDPRSDVSAAANSKLQGVR